MLNVDIVSLVSILLDCYLWKMPGRGLSLAGDGLFHWSSLTVASRQTPWESSRWMTGESLCLSLVCPCCHNISDWGKFAGDQMVLHVPAQSGLQYKVVRRWRNTAGLNTHLTPPPHHHRSHHIKTHQTSSFYFTAKLLKSQDWVRCLVGLG